MSILAIYLLQATRLLATSTNRPSARSMSVLIRRVLLVLCIRMRRSYVRCSSHHPHLGFAVVESVSQSIQHFLAVVIAERTRSSSTNRRIRIVKRIDKAFLSCGRLILCKERNRDCSRRRSILFPSANRRKPISKRPEDYISALLGSDQRELGRIMQILICLVLFRTYSALFRLAVSGNHRAQDTFPAPVVHLPQTHRRRETDLCGAVIERSFQVRDKNRFLAGTHGYNGGQANMPILILLRSAQQIHCVRKITQRAQGGDRINSLLLHLYLGGGDRSIQQIPGCRRLASHTRVSGLGRFLIAGRRRPTGTAQKTRKNNQHHPSLHGASSPYPLLIALPSIDRTTSRRRWLQFLNRGDGPPP